jgi:alpha-L-arabinofuranosidase
MYASAVFDKPSGDYIVKIANTNATERTIEVTFKGIKSLGEGTVTSIHDGNPDAFNSLTDKNKVTPKTSKVSADGNILRVKIPAKTFSVYRF